MNKGDNMNNNYINDLLNQVRAGAFLTTKDGYRVNTMTIGWLTVGRVWNEELVTVYVRKSRYTYDLIENSKSFTISVPLTKTLTKELSLWGTESGRDIEKLNTSNVLPTKTVDGILVKGCHLHIECEKIYQQAMDPSALNDKLYKQFYQGNEDFHTIYYGKIIEMYLESE